VVEGGAGWKVQPRPPENTRFNARPEHVLQDFESDPRLGVSPLANWRFLPQHPHESTSRSQSRVE